MASLLMQALGRAEELGRLTILIISVRSLASRTLTMAGGCSVVCSLELVPDFPGPP